MCALTIPIPQKKEEEEEEEEQPEDQDDSGNESCDGHVIIRGVTVVILCRLNVLFFDRCLFVYLL